MVSKYDAFADENLSYRNADLMEELYVEQQMSMSEIASELDCSTATVSRWIDRHGIGARELSEASRLSMLKKPAHFHTNNKGRELWAENSGEEYDIVQVHRLLAVAEYGLDAVVDKHIHHKNEIPWDNRPENLVPMDPSEHLSQHTSGNTRNEKITPKNCRSIQASEMSRERLAAEYGVCEKTVRRHQTGGCHHD